MANLKHIGIGRQLIQILTQSDKIKPQPEPQHRANTSTQTPQKTPTKPE